MNVSRTIIGSVTRERQTYYRTRAAGVAAVLLELDGPPSLGIKTEMVPRQGVKSGFFTNKPINATKHGSTMSLKFLLHGVSSEAMTANPAANTPAEIGFIEAGLGSLETTGYQAAAVGAASTAQAAKIKAAKSLAPYKAGNAAIFTDGSDFAFGVIQSTVDGNPLDDTVNFLMECLVTPAESSATYGVHCAYLSSAALVFDTLVCQLEQTNACIVLVGAIVTKIKVSGTFGKPAELEVELHCAEVITEAGAAISDFDYSYPVLPSMDAVNSTHLYKDDGTGTPVEIEHTSFELEVATEMVFAAFNNAAILKNRKATLKISQPIDDAPIYTTDTWNDDADPHGLLLVHGTTPGSMMAICVPNPVLVNAPGGPNDKDGLWSQDWEFEVGKVVSDTPTTDAAANSGLRIYLG